MQVQKDALVAVSLIIKSPDGQPWDDPPKTVTYPPGDSQEPVALLEWCLEGRYSGETVSMRLR